MTSGINSRSVCCKCCESITIGLGAKTRSEGNTWQKILILGMGNPILSDDSVGLRLAERLQEPFKNKKDIAFETASVGGSEIPDIICGYKKAIIIDSIKLSEAAIGDIIRFTLDDFREAIHLSNPHDTNLSTAIELSKMLGYEMPESVVIFAVNISDNCTFSETVTAAIETKFEEILSQLESLLEEELRCTSQD